MAGYTGIKSICGVLNTSISKISDRPKADIWSISDTPREGNLYQSWLNDGNWASITQGNNYASFVAVGASGSGAVVYFQYDNHSSGDTYNFTFDKVGTTGARIFELRISEDADLLSTTGGGSYDAGVASGSVSTSISASSSNSTIYIGFRKTSAPSTDTFTLNNILVSKS